MERRASGAASIGWAGSALVLTALVAIVAKIFGVIVAPGARGVLGGTAVNNVEMASGALAYSLTALLVALVCGASFELARSRSVGLPVRASIVGISGLILALVSPAVVERLGTFPSLALALVTSFAALLAGVSVLRVVELRAIGAILVLLAVCGLLHVGAWETSSMSLDHGSVRLYSAARGLATAAVVVRGIGVFFAAAWLGTRAGWQSRILANLAILAAFGLTWYAARDSDVPSTLEALLRTSLPAATGVPTPYVLGSVAAFLVPASVFLAGVALLERSQSSAVVGALALALLSHGSFDVPLHALLVIASAQWAMLAMGTRDAHGSR